MEQLSVGASLRFGWDTFKKRPWFFIGVVVAVIIVSSILSALTGEDRPMTALNILLAIAALLINVLIEMGLVSFALKAERNAESVTFRDLWHPTPFWYYVGTKILVAVVVVIGLILLVVPGIIAALMLLFATYLVIDRQLGPIEAMKESARITKGNRLQLFLLVLAIVGINILGVLALIVGLLVSIPVSLLAVAHAFRTLEKQAGHAPAASAHAAA